MSDAAYAVDFYAWANEQAALARTRSANRLDWDNVAEELDSLGKQQEWELYNRYVVLLTHLLKWRFQPQRRSVSWEVTIGRQRIDIARQFKQAPSLKSADDGEFVAAYRSARLQARKETRLPLDTFPVESPFTKLQALDEDYWPELPPDA